MTTVVEDDFTATGVLTALTSWTPTIAGTGYASFRSNSTEIWQVKASGAEANCSALQSNVHVAAQADPAATEADVDVEIGIGFEQVSGTNFNVGVFARGDATNCVTAYIIKRFASPDLFLEEQVDGVFTTLSSANTDIRNGDKFKLEVRGTAAKVYHDDNGVGYGAAVISTTVSVTGAGESGIFKGNMSVNSGRDVAQFAFGYGLNFFKLSEYSSAGDGGFPAAIFQHNNTLLRM